MQAFIKSTSLAECRLIPFIYRLVMLPASLSFLCHPTALTPALDSWTEPKPSADQDSTGSALASGTLATHRITSTSFSYQANLRDELRSQGERAD